MRNVLKLIRPSFHAIKQDKVNILLAMIPIIIGLTFYGLFGTWFFSTLMGQGQAFIESNLGQGDLGSILYYIVGVILSVLLFFIVNYTFVLFVTLISSPFNDLLSSRIEKKHLGKELPNLGESFSGMFKKLLFTLGNEIKKISLILFISFVAFTLGYIPLLTPLSFLLTAILLGVGFADYTWSRRDLKFRACMGDIKGNILGYSLSGMFFFVLVSIPVLNLVVNPMATSFYTLFYLENHDHRPQVTQ